MFSFTISVAVELIANKIALEIQARGWTLQPMDHLKDIPKNVTVIENKPQVTALFTMLRDVSLRQEYEQCIAV